MKNTIRIAVVAITLVAAQSASAHDPAAHAREAAEDKKSANCAAMHDMDMSKMDPNDPVMKAMMLKCAKHAGGHDEHAGHTHADDSSPAIAPKAMPDNHEGH